MSKAKIRNWWQDFKRRIVRADYQLGDYVNHSAYMGVITYSSPRDYLKSSKLGRFFDRVWRLAVIILFSFTLIVIIIGWVDGAFKTNILMHIVAGALALFSLWMVLISQGYLRWMHRHRNDPRRKS